MIAALMISNTARRLAECSLHYSAIFEEQASVFDRYATDVLDGIGTHTMAIEVLTTELYKDRGESLQSLVAHNHFEEQDHNQIDFALRAQNKLFLASSQVQAYMDRLWSKDLSGRANQHFWYYIAFVALFLVDTFWHSSMDTREEAEEAAAGFVPDAGNTSNSTTPNYTVGANFYADGAAGAGYCWLLPHGLFWGGSYVVIQIGMYTYIACYIFSEYEQEEGDLFNASTRSERFMAYLEGSNNLNDLAVIGLFLLPRILALLYFVLSSLVYPVVGSTTDVCGDVSSVVSSLLGVAPWSVEVRQDAVLFLHNGVAGVNFAFCVVRILEMYSLSSIPIPSPPPPGAYLGDVFCSP
jgi:hypothetical protein